VFCVYVGLVCANVGLFWHTPDVDVEGCRISWKCMALSQKCRALLRICRALVVHTGRVDKIEEVDTKSLGNVGLFCGYVGLFCGYVGALFAYTGCTYRRGSSRYRISWKCSALLRMCRALFADV